MLAIFDIEGVLVDGEFLPELAKLSGKGREVRDITERGIRGEIDWESGLKRRMEMVKGVSLKDCTDVADSLPIMKGASETINELKRRGVATIGVSGGFEILADRVKSTLGIDYIVSNRLKFEKGVLSGYELLVGSNKRAALEKHLGFRIDKKMTVAVVDGANDMEIFKKAALRIAFNAQKAVEDTADVIIKEKDLTKVLDHIQSRFMG